MKATPILPTLFLLLFACVMTAAALPSRAATTAPKTVTVDYVIALLDSGISQADIVARIKEKNLAFRLAPGDIDRLRGAGAGEELIVQITGGTVILENREGAPSAEPARPKEQSGAGTNGWEHPSRLGGKQGTTSGDQVAGGDDDEGIEETPYDGDDDYSYGSSYGYYGFSYSYGYPYPYYYYPSFYYPYYYPYRSYGYYSSPYFHHPHHSFRTQPRGQGSFRSAPRGGNFRSAPQGGGHRSSPRGSQHH
jgi:hypothetical protein